MVRRPGMPFRGAGSFRIAALSTALLQTARGSPSRRCLSLRMARHLWRSIRMGQGRGSITDLARA